jgi:hypothetical protein
VAPVADAVAAVALTAAALATAALVGRARFARDQRSFRCRIRSRRPTRSGRDPRWRRPTQAMWVHDVLLVRSGFLRLGLTVLPVCPALGARVQSLTRTDVRRLGRHPLALRLTRTGGVVEIAVPEDCRAELVGPFLVAELSDLPPAPREKGSEL